MKQIDINSQGEYPANFLSNLHPHPFSINGFEFGSIEGFLQGLRCENKTTQLKIFGLSGIAAKRESHKHPIKNQTLYFQGKPFNRHSIFYKKMVNKAYLKMFSQNPEFQKALASTLGFELIHSIGKTDPFDTILTNDEFLSNLNWMRTTFKKELEAINASNLK